MTELQSGPQRVRGSRLRRSRQELRATNLSGRSAETRALCVLSIRARQISPPQRSTRARGRHHRGRAGRHTWHRDGGDGGCGELATEPSDQLQVHPSSMGRGGTVQLPIDAAPWGRPPARLVLLPPPPLPAEGVVGVVESGEASLLPPTHHARRSEYRERNQRKRAVAPSARTHARAAVAGIPVFFYGRAPLSANAPRKLIAPLAVELIERDKSPERYQLPLISDPGDPRRR